MQSSALPDLPAGLLQVAGIESSEGARQQVKKVESMLDYLLSHPELKEDRYWRRQRFAANDTIINEGEQGRDVFLIRCGKVRVTGCALLEQGRAIHPGFCDLGDGDFFGEVGLLPRQTRTATVVAVTDCELAVIDGARLLDFFDAHPSIGYRFMLAMYEEAASRLDQTNRQLLRVLAWGLRAHRIEPHLDAGHESVSGDPPLTSKTG